MSTTNLAIPEPQDLSTWTDRRLDNAIGRGHAACGRFMEGYEHTATLTGVLLRERKARLGPRKFKPWLEEHFTGSRDTAYRYLAMADERAPICQTDKTDTERPDASRLERLKELEDTIERGLPDFFAVSEALGLGELLDGLPKTPEEARELSSKTLYAIEQAKETITAELDKPGRDDPEAETDERLMALLKEMKALTTKWQEDFVDPHKPRACRKRVEIATEIATWLMDDFVPAHAAKITPLPTAPMNTTAP